MWPSVQWVPGPHPPIGETVMGKIVSGRWGQESHTRREGFGEGSGGVMNHTTPTFGISVQRSRILHARFKILRRGRNRSDTIIH